MGDNSNKVVFNNQSILKTQELTFGDIKHCHCERKI